MRIQGLYPAVATPVRSDGAVDPAAFDRLCEFVLERGADGICVGGATSEYTRFEMPERLEMLRRAPRSAARGTTLLAAIAAPSLPRTLELGRAAFEAGYAAVLLPMPSFFRYQQGDLAAYCTYVAERLEGPCLLYDLPDFTNPLDPDTSIRLLRSVPNIVGIKDSSGRVADLRRFADARGTDDWTLLVGDDRYGLAAAEAGWDGAISGLACCCPELLVALHGSIRRGDAEESRRYQDLIDELIAHLSPLPTPWGVRAVLRVRGLDPGPMALPVSPERAAQLAHIDAWLPGWLAHAEIPNLLPVP
jgi:4-hydroxy-tetrahydrodipicolinate synthase